MPKFRGGSDDWLDEESSSAAKRSGSKPKKKPLARSTELPWEEGNATVVEVFRKQCRVRFEATGLERLAAYRRSEIFGSTADHEARERTPVAVGDRVKASEVGTDQALIEGLCARRNKLSRPAPGREEGSLHHVVAANIDLLVIVASVSAPVFSPGLIDRYLVAASAAGIPSLICITKADLVGTDVPAAERPWQVYVDAGIELVEVSARRDLGMAELRERLTGHTVAFCGHSGVGKTSLLRILLQKDVGRIGDISSSTGRGQHTTTSAVLLGGPGSSFWIDTPGVREFGLLGVEPAQLASFFPELNGLGCEQTGCLHLDEAGCRARELPRYPSYRRILESLLSGEH